MVRLLLHSNVDGNANCLFEIVFTASLVIIGRLLWAQHGQGVVDEAAASHSKSLLRKAENVFLKLDHENNLVLSCLEYIRRLARMCSAKGQFAPMSSQSTD